MKEFKEYLENLKKKINVDLLGLVKAEVLEKVKEDLQENIKLGYKTSFENEDLTSRVSPSFHLESAKSIFVIGMSYIWEEDQNPGKLRISNHARGLDYHKVLRQRLDDLVFELKKDYEFSYYIQVDSGNLYEKELGRLGGFGYIGKNSLLINEEFGSYIFLGILVTDISFTQYLKAKEGSCLDCEICIKSCPAKAIIGDYRINASICHSYLSQLKEDRPETKDISYAYGCDICQRVCPKNKDISKNVHEEFRPLIYSFDMEEIKNLSNKAFVRKYKDQSFSWVGRKVILRNIEILSEE